MTSAADQGATVVDGAALVVARPQLLSDPLLVALDFDGTLSELVAHPSLARPVPGALGAVHSLAVSHGVTVALVSGRPVADLRRVSGVAEDVMLIGSHGAEWDGRGDMVISAGQATALAQMRDAVDALVQQTPGAMIEPKPAGFAVHVRHSSLSSGRDLVMQVADLAEAATLHTLRGKSVIDVGVHPLDKGTAVAALRAELGNVTLLFAGDDVTDETVMAVARDTDVTIRVGPGETAARFRLPTPAALVVMLQRLADSRSMMSA